MLNWLLVKAAAASAVASAPAEASAVNSIKEEVDSVDAITYSEKLVNGDDNNIKSSEIDLKIVDSVEEHNKMEEKVLILKQPS